jgi:predicted dienelactone hydrolase
MDTRRGWTGILCILALLVAPTAALAAHAATGVGFASITIHDPVNGGTMPGYVFYPSERARGVTWIGPYELHATRNAAPVPGAKPLVVISHGHGGSDLDLHVLAVYLADHGFVTATLQHPEDNYRDTSGDGTPAVEVGRPIEVKATISMLLDDPHWKTLIDPNRIGVAGFSHGGYTVLMVVGAVPRFERWAAYCAQHPTATDLCGTPQQIAMLQTKSGKQKWEAHMAILQDSLKRWGNPDDPRVKAAFVMAPFGMVFDKAGLATINRPVFLYDAQDDHVVPLRYNTLHIAPLIKTLVGIKIIPKATHFVFLGPCSAKLAKVAPGICKVPPGVDRAAVYRQIGADALAFFRKTLDVPAH